MKVQKQLHPWSPNNINLPTWSLSIHAWKRNQKTEKRKNEVYHTAHKSRTLTGLDGESPTSLHPTDMGALYLLLFHNTITTLLDDNGPAQTCITLMRNIDKFFLNRVCDKSSRWTRATYAGYNNLHYDF